MKSIIQTPTNDLQKSLDFYTQLNFTILSENNPTLVTDGKAVIEINPVRFARAGVKLYQENWDKEVEQLRSLTNVVSIGNGFLISDPSGTWIYLLTSEGPQNLELEQVSPSTLGNYAGLSLETTNLPLAIKIWEILGFSKTMGDISQGWVVYGNSEGFGVSFMQPNTCPHLFFNPSMTYFNGKNNLQVIQNIRTAGIPITEEITTFNKEGIVDNVIIRDPGGYGFFIFSD